MPLFTEHASSSRNLRVLPSFAPPLPRLCPEFVPPEDDEIKRYEVVIVGAGPAGLMLQLLLSRYGLSDSSLLCIDSKPGTLKSGQADGIQPRTLEVFKTLGISDEIENEACQMWEFAFWNASDDAGKIIERRSIVPEVIPPARFPYEATIHQGRIERIMETDLHRYSARGVQRNTSLLAVRIDEEGDPDFPVLAEIQVADGDNHDRPQLVVIRTKHLVGADGAHSIVRKSLGLPLEGQSLDHIWGVVDLVVETDFPDIRRRCAVHAPAGSVMVIPRERISTGEYLTRLYVHVPGAVEAAESRDADADLKQGAKGRRSQVTLDGILAQASAVLHPYYIRPKRKRAVDWWAAYQIGQRVCPEFIVRDSSGLGRVFIVGDACHTHSPKAGQGMNVSMMDSYNLAWKLAYHINGLTPPPDSPSFSDDKGSPSPCPLLDTYHTERHENAKRLIDFDRKFSTGFSDKVGTAESTSGLSHAEFVDLFSTGCGFTSGCGVEYVENLAVDKGGSASSGCPVVTGSDYLAGILRPGHRLLNIKMKRFADGWHRDIQDDLASTGRLRIISLLSTDLLDTTGASAASLNATTALVQVFPQSLIEQIIIHPRVPGEITWESIPACVKSHNEMTFYSGYELDDAYRIYGVDPSRGALVVVRPDGYVGLIAELGDVTRVDAYLSGIISRAT
ncbi:FAD binding domain-containing protein [Aspergillus karnatakaensis]|uniref:FAD binding domain-containing protein n=1 Tax=Aspergillus karnatakaensis TaxID=1810916 RepID=UPI003CCDF0CC